MNYSLVAVALARTPIEPLLISRKALALVGTHAVTVATVRNADRLASESCGLPQTSSIALGAGALARLQADLVVATGGVALRQAEAPRPVQLVAPVA